MNVFYQPNPPIKVPAVAVELLDGHYALLDQADLGRFAAQNWSLKKGTRPHVHYLLARMAVAGGGTMDFGRWLLWPRENAHSQVDHRNGDGLDNRRVNLRWASPSENCQNKGHGPAPLSLGLRPAGVMVLPGPRPRLDVGERAAWLHAAQTLLAVGLTG